MTSREHTPAHRATRITDPTYVGLLTLVLTDSLDADYRAVADRRASTGSRQPATRPVGLLAVLVVFGALIGVSALQTEQDRPQASAERAELVEQIQQRKVHYGDLRDDISTVSRQVAALQATVVTAGDSASRLDGQLGELGVEAGTQPATGPGILVTVDDAVDPSASTGGTILDTDLRQLVNGLWLAGAEAIAIDGHRLSTLTAIRHAGQAITVDYRSLSPPYVLAVIGDPDSLPARLLETAGGQAWQGLEANFGIGFDITMSDQLTLPADPRDQLLYARPDGDR